MSLIKKETLIGLCCAAALLNLSKSTILQRKCGTENLTHVRRGTRVSLILEEVIQLKAEWISESLPQSRRDKANNQTGRGKIRLVS